MSNVFITGKGMKIYTEKLFEQNYDEWFDSQWQISKYGNYYRDYLDGVIVVFYDENGLWHIAFKENEDFHTLPETFITEEEAMLYIRLLHKSQSEFFKVFKQKNSEALEV